MNFFKKIPKDERIEIEKNKIASKAYKFFLILTILSLAIKLFIFKLEFLNFTFEIFIFIIPTLVIIIKKLLNRIPLILNKSFRDERINQILNKIYGEAFYICFIYSLIDSSRIIIFDDSKNLILCAIDMAVFFVTCLYFTLKSISSGIFISLSKKSYKSSMKNFKAATIIGSIFMGFVFNSKSLIIKGNFNLKVIPLIILGAALWGFPFYFTMKGFMKTSEHIADKKIK